MAADRAAPGSEAEHGEGFLLDQLTDQLDTLRLLREDDPERADMMLEQFGASGRVESEMLAELGHRGPLALPDRFPEAHRTVMRTVEVFDRNAARPPSSLRAGVVTPVASPVVQLLIGTIVRSYTEAPLRRAGPSYSAGRPRKV